MASVMSFPCRENAGAGGGRWRFPRLCLPTANLSPAAPPGGRGRAPGVRPTEANLGHVYSVQRWLGVGVGVGGA